MVKHPQHRTMSRVDIDGSLMFPVPPMRDTSPWHQWRRQRTCHKRGGHWWHPADAMIAWFCCQCGAERDGMPRDGSR